MPASGIRFGIVVLKLASDEHKAKQQKHKNKSNFKRIIWNLSQLRLQWVKLLTLYSHRKWFVFIVFNWILMQLLKFTLSLFILFRFLHLTPARHVLCSIYVLNLDAFFSRCSNQFRCRLIFFFSILICSRHSALQKVVGRVGRGKRQIAIIYIYKFCKQLQYIGGIFRESEKNSDIK